MPIRRRVLWALVSLCCVALLIAPAAWNGFPLLQYDTGGYLAAWTEGKLAISRSVPYGIMLAAGRRPDFWPVLIVQSALTVWLLALTLRAHKLGDRPLTLLAIVAALCLLTTLPWLTAILLTDIFAGLSVLALYLLLLRDEALKPAERIGLIALAAVAAATHSATLAVMLALTIVAAIVSLLRRARLTPMHLARAALALTLGACLVFTADFLVAGTLVWTPGGPALSFGRMLQDGIVKKYLDDHCPDPALRLCPYKDKLPTDADDFFWGEGLFDTLGRFDGLNDEMRRIAFASLADYPLLQLKSALGETGTQLLRVETGAGVVNWIWNTYETIKTVAPEAVPAMHGGAPAAQRHRLYRHQPAAGAARLPRHGPAAGHRIRRAAAKTLRRYRRIRRHRRARHPRQCRRVRHAGDRASPLRRAHRLARPAGRADRAGARHRRAPRRDPRLAGLNAPRQTAGVHAEGKIDDRRRRHATTRAQRKTARGDQLGQFGAGADRS